MFGRLGYSSYICYVGLREMKFEPPTLNNQQKVKGFPKFHKNYEYFKKQRTKN